MFNVTELYKIQYKAGKVKRYILILKNVKFDKINSIKYNLNIFPEYMGKLNKQGKLAKKIMVH